MVTFSKPYQTEGKEIDTVTFREPKAKDLFNVKLQDEAGQLEAISTIASRLSGYPKPLFDNLSIEDFGRVVEAISPLLAAGKATT